MKKATFILLFVMGIFFQIKAEPAAAMDKQFRDSIFQAAKSEPNDTLRSKMLRGAFQQYIGKETALEFLDSALVFTRQKGIHEEELYVLFDYCRHYEFRSDITGLEQYFQVLKETSYRYKDYSLYYTIWLAILQTRCTQGDTEYAIMQAKEMRKEAIRIKYDRGMFVSLIALARALDFAEQYDEAIVAYQQALEENPEANEYSLLLIHGSLAEIYLAQKKYTEALCELEQQQKILKKLLESGQQSADALKNTFLEIEISFSMIYAQTNDKENLKLHLTRAKMYYYKDVYFSY